MRAALSTGWLGDLRDEAGERFEEMAWPTTEDEEWRRTDIGRFDLSPFLAVPGRAGEGGCPWQGEPAMAAGYIRFDAGACAELALATGLQSRGVGLEALGKVSEPGRSFAAALLREAFATAADRVAVWHFAMLEYGALLYVPPGIRVDKPFFVDIEESGTGRFAAPQLAIVLGEGASATVVSRIRESPGSSVLCNARTDVSLGPGSALRLFDSRLMGPNSLHFEDARVRLAEASSLDRLEVQLGGRFARTRVDCLLEGRGAGARLDGLYYCGPGQEADIGVSLRHVSPGATSKAYYKGAVAGGGRAVFQGRIDVGEGASGTDAYLSNRNLLLGEAARADSIPTLRIGNDDVRCSHGSATGRLGDEELFYLRSRGLSEAEAREILVLGFFEDLLANAPESFREESLGHLRRRLPAAA